MRTEEAAFVLIGIVFMIGITLIPLIFYILTLQKTLMKVQEKNRKMQPTEVWLLLIPLFNIIWNFIVVNRMADSLAAEFRARNINVNQARPGYEIGLAYCICACCSVVPILGIFAGLAGFILWIIYWVKINEFKEKLSVSFDSNKRSNSNQSEAEEWFNG